MYQYNEDGIWRESKGSVEQITNFQARITHQIKTHDGQKTETSLKIIGNIGKTALPPITIPAESFQTLTWVAKYWGIEPIIMPVGNADRDARTAIQLASTPKTVDLYLHTGWTRIKNKNVYLHAGGGIDEKGNNEKIRVELPPDLSRYHFRPNGSEAQRDFRISLNLSAIAKPPTAWALLLTTYRAAIASADFSIHLAGRTGTFKTEIVSLHQSHYGEEMDARHIPGSWSSTANALEAQAYKAKNALFVLDDFVPTGTAWQVRTLQKTCDQIIRAQGNQQGRARLSDKTTLQNTYYPRGIILSTGEDVPEGQSIRARMLITELTPGDVDTGKLTKAQSMRPSYQNAMAHYIGWLALDLQQHQKTHREIAAAIRDQHKDLGHTRTPTMIGQLIATADRITVFGEQMGFLHESEAKSIRDASTTAIVELGESQTQYLEAADPADVFQDTIRQVLVGHIAHLKTAQGQTPNNPELAGWTKTEGPGGLPAYKSHGPQIGWTDWSTNHLYIDINSLMFLKRHAGGKLSMTRQTLLKRLKDANVLTRTEESRQRNTIRTTCEKHTRTVICIDLEKIMSQSDS